MLKASVSVLLLAIPAILYLLSIGWKLQYPRTTSIHGGTGADLIVQVPLGNNTKKVGNTNVLVFREFVWRNKKINEISI